MIDLLPVREELRAVAASTWPEVLQINGGGGINLVEFLDTVAWEKIPLPYAVIFADTMPVAPWSQDTFSAEPPFDIYYVDRAEDEGEGVLARAQALEAVLWPEGQATDPLESAQVTGVMGLSTSNLLPPNAVFVASGKMVRAAMLRVKILVEDPR
jgi:hypothetical protein